MMQQNSPLKLTLFQMENEADRYIQYTMVEQANTIARILAQKELPMFYFTEAGEELGIPPKTCRSWKINAWPTANQLSGSKLIYKAAIYIRVYLRLISYPKGETYAQATRRLQDRITELKDRDYSHNQLSQYLKLSFRTLKDIETKKPEEVSRRSHCPWALLERLEGAEAGMQERREREEELREKQILREGNKNDDRRPRPEPPAGQKPIERGSCCPKCKAPPHNLRHDGRDAWGREIMTCIICGNENPVIETPAIREGIEEETREKTPDQREFAERYDSCRECGTPWHNLKRERVDRWNNTVYICTRCTAVSRVRPKKQLTRAT